MAQNQPKIIFLTYLLETSPISGGTLPYATGETYGYSTPIHCNYIQQIATEDIRNKRINFAFDQDQFPFLKSSDEIIQGNDGTGWTASKIKALVQMLEWTGSTTASTVNFRPNPEDWKVIDLTSQIEGHVNGTAIHPTGLTSTLFEIKPEFIPTYESYNLDYLNYPTSLTADDNKLAFGEEVFFYGNVSTDIEAVAYTTDIAIILPQNQFNYTENPTWDGISPVQISEIGIFDSNNELVAIGKLNYPISKNSSQYRSFAFNIDF